MGNTAIINRITKELNNKVIYIWATKKWIIQIENRITIQLKETWKYKTMHAHRAWQENFKDFKVNSK